MRQANFNQRFEHFMRLEGEIPAPHWQEIVDHPLLGHVENSLRLLERTAFQSVGIIDYGKFEYVYLSPSTKSFIGEDFFRELQDKGVASFLERVHPYDRELILKSFEDYLNFVDSLPTADLLRTKISCCMRVLDTTGNYRWFLEEVYTLASQDRKPRIKLSLVRDIHSYCSKANYEATVEHFHENGDVSSYVDVWKPTEVGVKLENPYNLSQREHEIIGLLVEGKLVKEIADTLSISENTVKRHKQNIFEKLKFNNSKQLVAFAVSNGI